MISSNDYVGKINKIENTKLFITDMQGINDEKQLKELNIKCIINVAPEIKINEYPEIIYHHLNIKDSPDQNILDYFDQVFKIINDTHNNVVINCQGGISRSSSFIIAYLLNCGNSYEESYNIVKSSRSIICPNRGFVEQLKKYEKYMNYLNSFFF